MALHGGFWRLPLWLIDLDRHDYSGGPLRIIDVSSVHVWSSCTPQKGLNGHYDRRKVHVGSWRHFLFNLASFPFAPL